MNELQKYNVEWKSRVAEEYIQNVTTSIKCKNTRNLYHVGVYILISKSVRKWEETVGNDKPQHEVAIIIEKQKNSIK